MKIAAKNEGMNYSHFICHVLKEFLSNDTVTIKMAPFRDSIYPSKLYQTYITNDINDCLTEASNKSYISISKILEKALFPYIKDMQDYEIIKMMTKN